MGSFRGKNVLITGGAAGIGKIMGRLALERGAARLVIWDINKNALDSTVSEFCSLNYSVHGFIVDVSDVEQIKSAAAEVRNTVGHIDILINNAGIIVGKFFNLHSHLDIQKTMQINTDALMHVSIEFLQQMIDRKSGHICNISSAAGMIANPGMSVYCASKWAVIGWSESLRLEMKQSRSGVNITTVTPYYISTGMFSGVKSLIPLIKPEKAARCIIKGIEKNRKFVRIPWLIYLLQFTRGIMPVSLFDWFLGGLLGVYKSMSTFTGHAAAEKKQ